MRRFRCTRCGRTVSLLPQCLAARMSGTLEQAERVVRKVEQAVPEPPRWRDLHPAKHYRGWARAWAERRLEGVRQLLCILPTLVPEVFGGLEARWADFQGCLKAEQGSRLGELRLSVERHLGHLPAPVGFDTCRPRGGPAGSKSAKRGDREGTQHEMERGPPVPSAGERLSCSQSRCGRRLERCPSKTETGKAK